MSTTHSRIPSMPYISMAGLHPKDTGSPCSTSLCLQGRVTTHDPSPHICPPGSPPGDGLTSCPHHYFAFFASGWHPGSPDGRGCRGGYPGPRHLEVQGLYEIIPCTSILSQSRQCNGDIICTINCLLMYTPIPHSYVYYVCIPCSCSRTLPLV